MILGIMDHNAHDYDTALMQLGMTGYMCTPCNACWRSLSHISDCDITVFTVCWLLKGWITVCVPIDDTCWWTWYQSDGSRSSYYIWPGLEPKHWHSGQGESMADWSVTAGHCLQTADHWHHWGENISPVTAFIISSLVESYLYWNILLHQLWTENEWNCISAYSYSSHTMWLCMFFQSEKWKGIISPNECCLGVFGVDSLL